MHFQFYNLKLFTSVKFFLSVSYQVIPSNKTHLKLSELYHKKKIRDKLCELLF